MIRFRSRRLGFAVAAASLAWASAPARAQTTSFDEVAQAIFGPATVPSGHPDADEIRSEIAAYGTPENPRLPQYGFRVLSLIDGRLTAAANRTLHDRSIVRPYFQKEVHANGLCFVGTWEIDGPSRFTGYFAQGAQGRFVGRASTATPQTTSDGDRSFGMAGLVFPGFDGSAQVEPASFFVVDDLTGRRTDRYVDAAMTNEPPFDFAKLDRIPRLAAERLQSIFRKADAPETRRPLWPIARLGLPRGSEAVVPLWMMIRAEPSSVNPAANDADFRNELSSRRYPSGLRFQIWVSDVTKDASNMMGWQRIGTIVAERTLASFGCDRRVHFPHPLDQDPDRPQTER